MKKSFFILTLAIAAVAVSACKKSDKIAGDPLDSRICTLDNGLKVFMTVNKETPRIQTYIAVRAGGKNDPSETTGLAHYLEHLMFKGTSSFGTQDYTAEKPLLDQIETLYEQYRTLTDPDERKALYHKIDSISFVASGYSIPNEYDKMMAMIGARGTNAWTSLEETVYTEDIPSNQVENWARIQSDRFKDMVIRGFHTELEAVYEEFNMGLTSDTEKLYDALLAGLYPHHPYGTQTVIGKQDHLKNPSITNIKRQFNTYYRPNNVAICLSGDFDPDKVLAIIKKYFGDWESNPELPEFKFQPEEPITTPVVKEVFGQQAEMLALGWRYPGAADLKTGAVADIAGSILSNGQAGLMDLDLIQQQKVMTIQAGAESMADYGMFLALGMPKQGQSLDELRDLALGEIARLRSGDFPEELISATVNNIKLRKMRQLENNSMRARMYVQAFIAGIDWKDAVKDMERYQAVTKEDIVAFANEYLGDNAYVAVYKKQGEDTTVHKIEAPAITPIQTNRDKKSAFLESIEKSEVSPIEPVFLDFGKDMARFDLCKGVDVLYKQNRINDIATTRFIYNRGSEDDPALDLAFTYLQYLGTPTRSAEQIATEMYDLACSFSMGSAGNNSSITVSGLSENLGKAISIAEDLLYNAQPDENILVALKEDMLKNRADAKTDFSSCYSALSDYTFYGPEYIRKTTLSDEALEALTSEQLLSKVRELAGKGHEILYYGPDTQKKLTSLLKENHIVGENPETLQEKFAARVLTPEAKVMIAPYESKQFNYVQYSNNGEKADRDKAPAIRLFNEYFGGGMNGIVFQEMREARALAYSARAYYVEPSWADGTYSFYAFIGSQNDKMEKAVKGFDEIINDMPASENAFGVAREALLSRLRTERTTGMRVLDAYRNCRRLGLDEPLDKAVFEKVQGMTLEDLVKFQQENIKGRSYQYAILGDVNDIDMDFLSTLGPVKILTLEEIFGY